MIQLLSAGFARLFKNKLFWACNILLWIYFAIVVFLNYQETLRQPDILHYGSNTFLFLPFQVIGIFASCFTGMFLGTEYRDGTLRNKLITGKSRAEIYLSNLTLSFGASVFTTAAGLLITLTEGIALYGTSGLIPVRILQYCGLGTLMLAAFAGIFTLISMLIPSRTAGSQANILLFFLLALASDYVLNRLNQPYEILSRYGNGIGGGIQSMELVPNPFYLEGVQRTIYEFFRDLLPLSQGSLLLNEKVEHPLCMALCSLGIAVCTTLPGIYWFQKKDIK